MLTHEELEVILTKEFLEMSDLVLLEDHLLYIMDLFANDSEEPVPDDVFMSLERDVDRIIKKLQKENMRILN